MKKETTFEIEIQRSNVTPAQFLAYVRSRVDAKGGRYVRGDLDLDYFKRGDDLNFDTKYEDDSDLAGIHEKSISKPYEMQTYIRYPSGACYNEICEFEFDDDKKGHGYYYLVNVVTVDEPTAEAEEDNGSEDVTIAPAEAGTVWNEDGSEYQPETETNTNTEQKEEDTMNYTITTNDRFNSTEIQFDGKPAEAVRDALKALRFRWNRSRGIWYGYATPDEVRAAIGGQSGEKTANSTEAAPKASRATKATQKAQGTQQDHIRIYWNGIKIDGGRLIRCGYSIDNNTNNEKSVSIYARDYDHLPRDLFEVRNESDSYTDYFENDSAYLTPEHPLYKYFRFAAMKAKARDDSKYCEYLRETLNSGKREPWAGHYDGLRADLARREKTISEFAQMTDPGQPTVEDLEQIDRQRHEAENARKAAEHEEELRQRENYLAQRVHGQRLIKAEQEAHPIKADQPIVTIIWSEHPAFSDYEDGELLLSVTAAENILHTLDKEQHDTRETPHGVGWYYKTKFTISGVDFEGEPLEYEGRYDLGDGDGGLVQHIRSFGEWNRTHGPFGQTIENPEESNGTIRFADYLAGIIESSEQGEDLAG